MIILIIKIILLIFLGFIFLILLSPFKYSALVLVNEKVNLNLYLNWVILNIEFLIEEKKPFLKVYILGKLIKTIGLTNTNKHKNTKHKTTTKKNMQRDKSKKKKDKILSKGFLLEMFSLSKNVFKVIKPKELIIAGTYGFEDPAITGVLNLVLIFITEIIPWAQIDLNPVYEEEVMLVEIKIYGNVSLIILIFLMLKYVCKSEVRKVLFTKLKRLKL